LGGAGDGKWESEGSGTYTLLIWNLASGKVAAEATQQFPPEIKQLFRPLIQACQWSERIETAEARLPGIRLIWPRDAGM
jgi:hypothetical protein